MLWIVTTTTILQVNKQQNSKLLQVSTKVTSHPLKHKVINHKCQRILHYCLKTFMHLYPAALKANVRPLHWFLISQ